MEKTISEHCAILDVSPHATPQEIKQAYRDLVRIWHPDRCHGDERLLRKSEEKLKAINEAYEVLRDGVPTHYGQGASSYQAGSHRYESSQPAEPTGFSHDRGPVAPEQPAVVLACISAVSAFFAGVFILPSFLGSNVTRQVSPGGWFSSAKYSSSWETSWGFVVIYSLIFAFLVYNIVRSRNFESLIGLVVGAAVVVKITSFILDFKILS